MDCTSVVGATARAAIQTCIVQPPDWRIYITPGLVAISAVIAFFAMRTTRSVARQRATIDLIEKAESTPLYRTTSGRFSEIRRSGGFAALNDPQTDADKADRQVVIDYLNHYELVSLGIINGALDEKIYRLWMRGPFTRDWNAASGWIQRERWKRGGKDEWVYYPTVFANYQTMARRWSKESVLLKAIGGGPAEPDARGPGSELLPAPVDTDTP